MKCFVMIDVLETRVLMTVTPSPVVAADLEAVKADLAKLNADQGAVNNLLAMDRAAIDAAVKALAGQTELLKGKVAMDEAKWKDILKADAAAISAAEAENRPTLVADLAKIEADKDNPDLLKADKAQLELDRAAIGKIMDPLRAQLKADTLAWHAEVAADRKAIEDVVNGDGTVKAARAKLEADRKAGEALLKADKAKLDADVAKLKKDQKGNHEGDKNGSGDQKGAGDKKVTGEKGGSKK